MSLLVGLHSSLTRRSISYSISRVNTRFASSMAPKGSNKDAEGFIEFVNAAPTPYHAVHEAKARLEKAGYKKILERDSWASTVVPGGKYYLTRNASTLVAFAVGKKWKPGNPLAIAGSHVDSCTLRIKPNSRRQAEGWLQLGVEKYGGGMWHSWFDRDLGVAGRVMVKTGKGIEPRLVNLNRPICKIPSLAVHFGGSVPFEFSTESQLYPIVGLVEAELRRLDKTEAEIKKEEAEDTEFSPLKKPIYRHQSKLLEMVAEDAGVEVGAIVDFELILYDVHKSCIGGLNNELIYSARLDNLMMTYCGVEGLIKSTGPDGVSLDNDSVVRVMVGFDHEEIGSTSAQGANGTILLDFAKRLNSLPITAETDSEKSYDKVQSESAPSGSLLEQCLATSFVISADMSHGVHPNYSDKHEKEHRPILNKGTVIKINANQRYATNSPGIVLVQEMARRAKMGSYDIRSEGEGVPLQTLVVKNDAPCGSTIGPMTSANTGIRTLDLGNPQLAMHSIRETCGTHDVEYAINLFESYFGNYSEVEPTIFVD